MEKLAGHEEHAEARNEEVAAAPEENEKKVVSSAVRTDFILSAEIMVIALNEVASEGLVSRAVILAFVAVVITLLVYGVVALIVKMDDAGLALSKRETPAIASFGRGLVKAMPIVLATLSNVGIVAMLWVGGHILLVGVDELGFHPPYAFVHHLEELLGGGFPGWLVNTACSAVIGLVVGGLLVAIAHLLPRRKQEQHA